MKRLITLVVALLLVLVQSIALCGCSFDEYSENVEPTAKVESEPSKLVYEMHSKGNNSYVEFDLMAGTVTTYNTISGKKGTTHTTQFSGSYPNTIEAYFEELESTKTFTFDGSTMYEDDSRGYSHTFKLYSKE